MSIRTGVFSVLAGVALGVSLTTLAMADTIDILRSVPLEVKGYPAGQQMPEHMQTADQVLSAIDSSPVLLIHMEALRRGYADLSDTEREKVIAKLMQRRKANENDLRTGFDYGYAELVYHHNKTGLFFLRKANDRFADQFSSLAYGMAEVEADLTLEDSTPDQMTTRKLDATFQLGDSVRRDAANHQPGFWPSFVRVIDKLKPIEAYGSFSRRDFSLVYVPYGSKVVPLKSTSTTASLPLQQTSVQQSATPQASSPQTIETPVASSTIPLKSVPTSGSLPPSLAGMALPVDNKSTSTQSVYSSKSVSTTPSTATSATMTESKTPLSTTEMTTSTAAMTETTDATDASALNGSVNATCSPEPGDNSQPIGNVITQRSASFNGNSALIQFYPSGEDKVYRVRVVGNAGQPMLSFKTNAMPSIVEDIDGDGTLEIVARQYQYNPYQPVLVYRYTPCGFELDKKIFNQFQ